MRKFILSSLASVALAGGSCVASTGGEGASGTRVHAQDTTTLLGGKAPQVQVPDVQAVFSSATLDGARFTPVVARNSPDLEASGSLIGDLLPAEGGSSGAILLAGALVGVAVVLRRLS